MTWLGECGCYPCVICRRHFRGCPFASDDAESVMIDWGGGPTHSACRAALWAPLEEETWRGDV
jgi:hypothetical protein